MELDQAVARVADAAQRHGKAWGIPSPTPELIRKYRAQGAQMLVNCGDFALARVLETASSEFAEALGE
jgi:2-keto-3-deoxy-L-rhamnonate aldolase RhmA